ncbi:ubiquitin carboxyl-terminal hydrolase-domain-containing protein [Blakeslea trispora]|nr:ubiquitin carboxyl-terminal hydrolase-domain-containing protein [Blakeslea trispora]
MEKSRKRDKIWKLIFPHKRNQQSEQKKRSQEQSSKITSLATYAEQHFDIQLSSDILENILEGNDWDSKRSVADLIDYEEASHGILISPKLDHDLAGAENDKGTSCYIDSLLFAMFVSNTTFDPLLTYDIPIDQDNKIKLQTLFRLFVNKLRKGRLINADHVHWLRKVLQEANWNGQDEAGYWTQEDASELFLFITETFELPYLPFQIRLFHGANKDSDDDRVMTDRTLSLSIPDGNDKTEIKLEDILVDYFYNSIITGIRREVNHDDEQDIHENVAASPTVQSLMDEKPNLERLLIRRPSHLDHQQQQVAVTAWQVLELLPFYSATNEQGVSISSQLGASFPDTHMILPIVLKRYRYDHAGGSHKVKRRVEIPSTIDFNRFVNQNVDDPVCPTCGRLVDWTLCLKSAVCHKGDSPLSGHYISYARKAVEEEEGYCWLRLDDMQSAHRVVELKQEDATVDSDLAENAYILFYELDKTCHHQNQSSTDSSISSVSSAEIMKQKEGSSCLEKPSKKKEKKQHTHHHACCVM